MKKPKSYRIEFPNPLQAPADEPACFGGDLAADTLLTAYTNSYFPWFNPGEPILWWSPDPRMVLFPEQLKVSKSMRSVLNKHPFQITFNQAFNQVILACAEVPRPGQDGTWISDEIVNAYMRLHELGIAQSVEAWQLGKLVGGLYGLRVGHVFFGESMFAKATNASKAAFITAVEAWKKEGVRLIDCQIYTEHLASLGAATIPRKDFILLLQEHAKDPNLGL